MRQRLRSVTRKRVSGAELFTLFNFEGLREENLGSDGAKVRGCSSVGRAPALQAGGRQFESVHLHQIRKKDLGRRSHERKWAEKNGLIAQVVRAHA